MFDLPSPFKELLDTPCIVIDERVALANIRAMQKAADAAGVKLRPHVKTHKMPYFARLQVEAGASGITCCKVSEAEVMADGGLRDIFLAYPLPSRLKIQRAIALSRRLDRLILAVDSLEIAKMMEEEAKAAGVVLEVRVEVDTGARRTGVASEKRRALFKALLKMKHLRVSGLYTFKSLVLSGEATQDNEAAGAEEAEMLFAIREEMIELGYPKDLEISGGSTPTGLAVAKSGLVDEIRPGTYIFNDYMLYKEKASKLKDCAAKLFAAVVSVPKPTYAVLDGGTKTFPTDITPGEEPFFYPGYGYFDGREDLTLLRMNEEHGIVTSLKGEVDLAVGQVLAITPIHVCTAINLQNEVYIFNGKTLRKEKVAARGMLS